VLERTASAVARALDNVDDALFALADKAASDVVQSRYFDAMRELRLKRRDIEDAFKRDFSAAAEALIARRGNEADAHQHAMAATAGLSLVEHDDLEESLAISTLTAKLEALCHTELFPLCERVRFLLDRDTLDGEALPVGPKMLCGAFKSACDVIESGVDIKIIVFKLFDRYVCETLPLVYAELNGHLAGNGVLPKIATRIRNGLASRTPDGLAHGLSDELAAAEPDFLAAFAQLSATAGGGLYGGLPLAVPGTAAPLMIRDLTLLQQGQWETLAAMGISVDPALLAGGTTNVVRMLKDNAKADPGDGLVLEVVALLFDYIFDNDSIPSRAKALIGRLQIPTLKVAMLDKTFFSKRHHPARRLLNTLAHASVGLADDGDATRYQHLEDCIQRVQTEFDNDIQVFEAALRDLEEHLDRQDERLAENIAEARKLIEGQERLKIAESLAETEIENRLDGRPYPEFVRGFALDHWKNLLLVAYMKEGRESEAWKSRLETLDLLIWSTLPKTTLKDKRQLVAMLPGLLASLEKGMKMLALDEQQQGDFLERLATCHARAVNETGGAEPLSRSSDLAVRTVPEQRGDVVLNRQGETDGPAAQSRRLGDLLVENIAGLADPAPAPNEDERASHPPLLRELDPFAGNGDSAPAPSDEITELVQNLVPGVWLEFHQDGDKQVERLSWISTVLASYLFTDRDGMKTRELSAAELEAALREGRAAVADDMSLLVDRSLSALLDDLQKKVAV